MSMLSSQCDELRNIASRYEDYGGDYMSRVLRDAADTIENLRERLQDDMLRGEIVRCRDCVWYQPWRTFAGEQENDGVCDMTHHGVGEDGFCAWGERREQ